MMDIVNMNLEAGQIVEVTTAPSTPPKKLTVPILGLEKFPTQQEIEGQDVRNRRPVRPIDRQRMRPWLMELLDLGNVFGLRWTNRDQGIFQISWRHASRLGWNLETDGDVFERWARHTGIYKEGDPPEPKRWKANFRCALHSLHDVMELTNAVERRGRNACRTYQFLQNNSVVNPKSKSKEKKMKPIEPKAPREVVHVVTYERPIRQPVQIQLPESGGSSEELLSSETESEGSLQDKVIVQRVDPKSGEVGEEEFLLHDHDYSGQQDKDKTQRTIYLRQGVGSIVLHKEVLNAPQLLEDAKAAEALSNLEQLASAAVDSQEGEGGAIMIDANVFSGGSNKSSPTKSSSLNEDESAISLKKLLPRLRARIKESERADGMLRKRKYLAEDMDMLGEKRIMGNNQYRLKKVRSDQDTSPPSPPRRRSGSPQKQAKGSSTKSKRSRKESEGSASDSTEPLMSSCLLLLEAATRLDKAEKGESLPDKKSLKHGRKSGDRSSNVTAGGKKKKGVRAMRFETREQEVIEEPVLEGIGETAVATQEETVIEEQVIWGSEDCVQIVYEDHDGEIANAESEEGEDQAFDILRTALENIGSEMEVSTSSDISSPKEMAIMRRKRDSDRPTSSGLKTYTVSDGKIVVTESSFAKGLFSGSEIIPHISQSGSGGKKGSKFKTKPLAHKDNIYYVDVRSNGGLISVKQSDNADGTSDVNDSDTTSQSQASLSTSPQIYIAAGQNASGQKIAIPPKNPKIQSTVHPVSAVQNTSGKSFITLGPKVILRPHGAVAKGTAATVSSPSSSINQSGSQILPSNVKISTLPIISTLQPSVSIPAPTNSNQRKPLSSSSSPSSSVAVSPKSISIHTSPSSGQPRITLVSSQTEDSNGQSTNTYYIKPEPSDLNEQDSTELSAKAVRYIVNPGDKSTTMVESSSVVVNEAELHSASGEDESSGGTINAEVIIDPVKGPYLQLPNSSTTIPLSQDMVLTTSPNSGNTTQTFTIRAPFEESEAQHYSQAEDGANLEESVELYTVGSDGDQVNVKTEPGDAEEQTVIHSKDEEAELVYTVQSEDGTSYYIPVRGQHDSPPIESTEENNSYPNETNVQMVTTEAGDQTCFISPEQLEQANHIIHISQEGEAVIAASAPSDVQSEMGRIESNDESSSSVVVKTEVEDEQFSVSVPSSSSMNIDPRAPLVIQEIPLFASSKGESEDQSV